MPKQVQWVVKCAPGVIVTEAVAETAVVETAVAEFPVGEIEVAGMAILGLDRLAPTSLVNHSVAPLVDTPCVSVAGDSIASSSGAESDTESVIMRRTARTAPKQERVQGDPDRSRGQSSRLNKEPEVGNFGFYLGNWGCRGTVADTTEKVLRRDTQDRQVLKCPAQVIVLCEATVVVEEMLQKAAVAGNPDRNDLEGRSTCEHFVVRGSEKDQAVLIAARTDTTKFLQHLDYEVFHDHPYREKGKN